MAESVVLSCKNKNPKFTASLNAHQMQLKLAFPTSVLIIFFLSSFSQTKDFKRYSIKSGIVKYQMTGMQKGTAEMYFDNFGMNEATYEKVTLEMYDIKQESETVSYLKGYWQYNLDISNTSATKMKNTALESLVEESEDGDLIEVGHKMFYSIGGKKVGQEEIIGHACEIWELEPLGTKVWVWKNIPLRYEIRMMGFEIIKVAVSLDENVVIPNDKLEIPESIDFVLIEHDKIQQSENQ